MAKTKNKNFSVSVLMQFELKATDDNIDDKIADFMEKITEHYSVENVECEDDEIETDEN